MLSPLLLNLNLPLLDSKSAPPFFAQQDYSVLGLFADPVLYPENSDVAVVYSELLKTYPILQGALAKPEDLAAIAKEYGVVVFPALVFLKQGVVVKIMARIHNWSDYIATIDKFTG